MNTINKLLSLNILNNMYCDIFHNRFHESYYIATQFLSDHPYFVHNKILYLLNQFV